MTGRLPVTVLASADVAAALPPVAAIQAVREAFIAVYRGTVVMPARVHLDAATFGGTTLAMPAHDPGLGRTVVKVVSVYPDNRDSVVTGVVVLLDGATGVPLGLLDGAAVTARRTGAASGVATDALARPDSAVLAIVGAGGQAPDQVRAVCAVRPIRVVRVANRSHERALALARRLDDELTGVEVEVTDIGAALADADVVCTATGADEPVLAAGDIAPGTHVNAIGSFRPGMCELPRDLIAAAGRVYVDQVAAAMTEAGEVIDALEAGVIGADAVVPIGAVLAGSATGRQDPDEITVFKTTGVAAQDLYAAAHAVEQATKAGLGTRLAL